jgi:uncharacterized membrane protein YoaK (UPF0700 family)
MTLHQRRLIAMRRKTTGLVLVALISFMAGMTDAVGLMLSGDFVSFMTGNTTRAALALSNGDVRHAMVLLVAILVFVAGNALGVVLAQAASRPAFVVLGWASVLLSIASTFAAPPASLPQFLLIVLAMGMVNATVEHVEGLPIGLTYVTGALSRFGRGIGRLIVGDRDMGWTVQIVPWIGMLAGAISGALLTHRLGDKALLFVALTALVIAFSTLVIPRALQHRYRRRVVRQPYGGPA